MNKVASIKKLTSKNKTIGKIEIFKKDYKNFLIIDPDIPEDCCMLCGKKYELEELHNHHIIPKRLKIKNSILKHITIRICFDCDLEVHPEHNDPEHIIKNLMLQNMNNNKKINNIKNNKSDNNIIGYINTRLGELYEKREKLKSQVLRSNQDYVIESTRINFAIRELNKVKQAHLITLHL